MIKISDKRNCCGCTACSQVCPKQCIEIREDQEGFKYPLVNPDLCVNCGLCEKVCPYLNSYPIPEEKPASFACKTKDDELRGKSSSGGLFTVLATKIIKEGGVVFGAKFDTDWSVIHSYTKTVEGLADFRGSKYVQSDMGDCFTQVKEFLKSGRKVMFTGTPCQVAGLNHFLQKQYDNLFTVDFVCHCVPSPKVWKKYLDEIKGDTKITHISFRDKSEGWARFGLAVTGETVSRPFCEIRSAVPAETVFLAKGNHLDNIYMKAFLSNLTVRPGCTNCPARYFKSGADITIADCWGFNEYHPELNDNKGMSLALLLTEKGIAFYQELENQLDSLQIPYVEVQEETNHNPIIRSPKYHPYRADFFKDFIKGKESAIALMTKYITKEEKNIKRRECIKSLIRKILGPKLINKLRGR